MRLIAFLVSSTLLVSPVLSSDKGDPVAERAAATEAQMRDSERTVLTHGFMAMPFGGPLDLPADGVAGAGYIHGIPRLGVPSLKETDASLGVSYAMGIRGDGGATALPSGTAMGATWNPGLITKWAVPVQTAAPGAQRDVPPMWSITRDGSKPKIGLRIFLR